MAIGVFALTASKTQATEFARQHRLLLSNVDLGRQQLRNGFCMMGTANMYFKFSRHSFCIRRSY